MSNRKEARVESAASPLSDEDVITDVFVGDPMAIDPEPGRFCEPCESPSPGQTGIHKQE